MTIKVKNKSSHQKKSLFFSKNLLLNNKHIFIQTLSENVCIDIFIEFLLIFFLLFQKIYSILALRKFTYENAHKHLNTIIFLFSLNHHLFSDLTKL